MNSFEHHLNVILRAREALVSVNASSKQVWDVAIIGAGMGGSFAAHALAESGHDVLLIEYGNEKLSAPGTTIAAGDRESRLSENRWPLISAYQIDGVLQRSHAPLGSGVGGSTNLYAAALERFDPSDIDNCPTRPTLGWPIRYSELLPYYVEAERLLHVIGTQDPLGVEKGAYVQPPPPLGPCDSDFVKFFKDKGLHPYRLHVGIRYRPGCDECLGRLCQKDCRVDARTVIEESMRKPTIMARSEVVELEALADRVTRAVVIRDNHRVEIKAKVFVLAAGAIHTPKLLLRSRNQYWKTGLANRSGLVGRNLMFHVTQAFALWPDRKYPAHGPRKSLSFRDFYEVDGQRCGSVQSSGFSLDYRGLLLYLFSRFDQGGRRRLGFLRPLLRIQAALATRWNGLGTTFVCITEDMPYPENRVMLDEQEEDGIRVEYTLKKELRDRVALIRKLVVERLTGRRLLFLTDDGELNFGHPCGTCVMSDDPANGVVDRDCRAHGIENLYIADASFMPTSAATNPSLTVAANALRVAAKIGKTLSQEHQATAAHLP